MEKLRGVVERITYANADKGYSVLKIRCKGLFAGVLDCVISLFFAYFLFLVKRK